MNFKIQLVCQWRIVLSKVVLFITFDECSSAADSMNNFNNVKAVIHNKYLFGYICPKSYACFLD